LHSSQNISQDVVSDTDNVFEDSDNSSHDLPEDIDRHGSTRSHRARQLHLAEGWSSVRDSILDGMVPQAALPPDLAGHLCGEGASVPYSQCGPHAYFCLLCAEQLHTRINLFHTPLC